MMIWMNTLKVDLMLNIDHKTTTILVLFFVFLNFQIIEAQIKCQTPYGEIVFQDDDTSENVLDWLSLSCGNQKIDSINSLIIMDVARKSDGALGELMGSICFCDFTNKPNVIISIFLNKKFNLIKPYFDHIAWEICLSSCLENIITKLKLIDYFQTAISNNGKHIKDLNTFRIIIDYIWEQIEQSKKNI